MEWPNHRWILNDKLGYIYSILTKKIPFLIADFLRKKNMRNIVSVIMHNYGNGAFTKSVMHMSLTKPAAYMMDRISLETDPHERWRRQM